MMEIRKHRKGREGVKSLDTPFSLKTKKPSSFYLSIFSKPRSTHKPVLDFSLIIRSADPFSSFFSKLTTDDLELIQGVEDTQARRNQTRFHTLIPSANPDDYTTLRSSWTHQDRVLHVWWRLKASFPVDIWLSKLKKVCAPPPVVKPVPVARSVYSINNSISSIESSDNSYTDTIENDRNSDTTNLNKAKSGSSPSVLITGGRMSETTTASTTAVKKKTGAISAPASTRNSRYNVSLNNNSSIPVKQSPYSQAALEAAVAKALAQRNAAAAEAAEQNDQEISAYYPTVSRACSASITVKPKELSLATISNVTTFASNRRLRQGTSESVASVVSTTSSCRSSLDLHQHPQQKHLMRKSSVSSATSSVSEHILIATPQGTPEPVIHQYVPFFSAKGSKSQQQHSTMKTQVKPKSFASYVELNKDLPSAQMAKGNQPVNVMFNLGPSLVSKHLHMSTTNRLKNFRQLQTIFRQQHIRPAISSQLNRPDKLVQGITSQHSSLPPAADSDT